MGVFEIAQNAVCRASRWKCLKRFGGHGGWSDFDRRRWKIRLRGANQSGVADNKEFSHIFSRAGERRLRIFFLVGTVSLPRLEALTKPIIGSPIHYAFLNWWSLNWKM